MEEVTGSSPVSSTILRSKRSGGEGCAPKPVVWRRRAFREKGSERTSKGEITMALKVGDKAPDFELTTKSAEGPKKIKLSSNSGKKNTVLLFFPMAFTGGCTKEMCEVS